MNTLTKQLLFTIPLLPIFLFANSGIDDESAKQKSFFQQQIFILKQQLIRQIPRNNIHPIAHKITSNPENSSTTPITTVAQVNSTAVDELIPSGSYIINMGVLPQTEENALKPYGLIWELLHDHLVPIKWAINPNKTKDGIDFIYNGVEFKGGPFIIQANHRSAAVNTVINNWEAAGVTGLTTTIDFNAPIDRTIKYSMNWTLDHENGDIAQDYLDAAGIPESAYNWVLPEDLNCCNDVFLMPHSHPDWDSHNNLYYWNDAPENGGCSGAIWAGCKAVSDLENIYNPSNPSEKLNFLMLDAIAPATNPAVWSDDHDDGELPYSYALPNNPIMQFMGLLDGAQENGAEQIYLPTNGWRPTTQIGIWQPVHDDIPSLSPGLAAKLAFGYAFGDTNRGYVGYQAAHKQNKSDDAENIAAQRAFLNFSFRAVEDKAIKPLVIVPPTMSNGITYNLNVSATGGTGNYAFEWSSDCPGTFGNRFSSTTTFTPGLVLTPTECIIELRVTDDCGNRFGFEKTTITITPSPQPPVALDDYEVSLPGVPVTADAIANDYDPNLDPLTLTLIGSGTTADGVFVNNNDGTVTYTSDLDFIGTDSIDYEICDTTGLCDTATIIIVIDITDVNGCFPSEYYGVAQTGNAEAVLTGNHPSTDAFTKKMKDELEVIGIPDSIYALTDEKNYKAYFTLRLADEVPAGVTVNIYGDSDDNNVRTGYVFAVLDSTSLEVAPDNPPISIPALIFNTDDDKDTWEVFSFQTTAPTRYLMITGPDDSKLRIDAIEYDIYDCITAIPTALKDNANTLESNSVNYHVQINDSDPQGLLLTTSIVQQGVNGTAVAESNGSVTYSPNANFSGLDSIIYQVCNTNNLCAQATFCILVADDGCPPGSIVEINEDLFWGEAIEDKKGVNDEDNAIGLPDGVLTDDIKDTDDRLDIEISGAVLIGDSIKVYHSGFGQADIYVSNDNIAYTLEQDDVLLTTNPYTFVTTNDFAFIRFMGTTGNNNEKYNIDAVEIPVYRTSCLTPFIFALDDQQTTTEFTPVDIEVLVNDLSLPGLNTSTVSNIGLLAPANGNIEDIDLATGIITYLPNAGFNGIDSFEYVVCNLSNLCDTALVTVSVYCNIGGTQSGVFIGKKVIAAIGVDKSYNVVGYSDDITANDLRRTDELLDLEMTGTVLAGDSVHVYSNASGIGNIYTSLDNNSYSLAVFEADLNTSPFIFEAATDFKYIRFTGATGSRGDKYKLDAVEVPYAHESDPVAKGYVFYDNNGNQNLDAATEALQDNVKLYAYKDVDEDGTISSGDILVDSTFTNSSGRYGFTFEIPTETSSGIINKQISQSSDDAEESPNVVSTSPNLTYTSSGDLELVDDGGYNGNNQLVGLRFEKIAVPEGAIITSANLSFVGYGNTSTSTNLIFYGEAVDDAATYSDAYNNLSNRPRTNAGVNWNNMASWSDNNVYTSPNLSAIVQEIVDRPGWRKDKDMAFIITGNGTRRAYSYNNDPSKAPILTISYLDGGNIQYLILMDTSSLPPNKAISTGITEQVIFTGPGQGYCAVNFGIYNHLPPVALNDTVYTEVGVNVPIDALMNDYDPENTPLSIQLLTFPDKGTAVLNATNTVGYIRNSKGTETFDYYICDSGIPSLCDTASITVIVEDYNNDPPQAMDDYDTLVVNSNIVTDVRINDFEPEYGALVISLNPEILQPANGTVIIYGDNNIQYSPNYTYTGDDVYEYIVCDTESPALCDTATVYIHVTNRPPDAQQDKEKTGIDLPLVIDILNNDREPDGHDIILTGAGTDAFNGQTNQGGIVVLNNNGTPSDPTDDFVDYTPPLGYIGLDTFYYHIDDSGTPTLSDETSVFIEITPLIDLELQKDVSPAITSIGQNVTFTLTLTNQGPEAASGILVRDRLPSDYIYVSDNGGGAYYNYSGVWYVPYLAIGNTTTLEIQATITSNSNLKNITEVIDVDQTDIDSSPANDDGDQSEDDEDFATPVLEEICGNGMDDDGNGLTDCDDLFCGTSIIGILTFDPTNCPDLDNGIITITASGANLEYSIDNGASYQASGLFNNLTGGSYSIRVRNNVTLCYSDSTGIVLTNPTCIEICDNGIDDDGDGDIDNADSDCITIEPRIITYPNDWICSTTGYIFEAEDNGIGVTYSWDFGANASPMTTTGIGPHTVQFTVPTATNPIYPQVILTAHTTDYDVTDTINLQVRPNPIISNVIVNTAGSCNSNTVSIDITVTGATGICFEVSLDGGATWEANNNTSFTGLGAGSYDLVIRYCDTKCVINYGLVTISDPTPVIVIDDLYKSSCPGFQMQGNVGWNDQNLDNVTFSLLDNPSNGVINFDDNGTFEYMPTLMECNTDQFSYQACNQTTNCCAIGIARLVFSDTLAPRLVNIPADLTINCDEEIPTPPLVSAFDNCPAIGIDVTEENTQGEDGCSLYDYTLTRTWTATDVCGNTVSDQQIIEIQDITAPNIYRIYTLPNGKKLIAGVMENVSTRWKTIQLPIDFATAPLIFTQVSSTNETTPVVPRIRNISLSQFELKIQEEAGNDGAHLGEKVAWIAIEAGTQNTNHLLETRLENLTNGWQSITFNQTYSSFPALFTSIQTTNDTDPAYPRYNNLSTSGVLVKIAEELSDGLDAIHSTEKVAIMAIDTLDGYLRNNQGQLIGEVGQITLEETWKTISLKNKYYNPVVVASSLSHADGAPATIRVKNVTTESFELHVEEWDYLDGNHPNELVSYMVVEGTVPLDIPFFCDAETDSLTIGKDIVAIDNCDVNVSINYAERDSLDGASIIKVRTWSAVDECGNETQFQQNLPCLGVALRVRSVLQGAMTNNGGNGLMRDDLRKKGLIPLEEPYTALTNFKHTGTGGGETLAASALNETGPNAIVDWIMVELRPKATPGLILATQSVLVTRDGDVIDTEGDSIIIFSNITPGDYYVSVKHRNHLSMMTLFSHTLNPNSAPLIDFTYEFTPIIGRKSTIEVDGKRSHWSGDLNGDSKIVYQGPNNDLFYMFLHIILDDKNTNYLTNYITRGYTINDFNMDGIVIFQGPNNDKASLLWNTVLKHEDNKAGLTNFVIQMDLPNQEADTIAATDFPTKPASIGKDTYINQKLMNAGENYGKKTNIHHNRKSGEEERGMMQFDLSDYAGGPITSAKMYMFLEKNEGGGNIIKAHRITTAWQEGEGVMADDGVANWTQATPTTNWLTPGGDYSPQIEGIMLTDTLGYQEMILSPALIQDWIDHPETNFGIMLFSTGGTENQHIEFSSFDGVASQRPYLMLNGN